MAMVIPCSFFEFFELHISLPQAMTMHMDGHKNGHVTITIRSREKKRKKKSREKKEKGNP